MSVELIKKCIKLETKKLTQIEKHILTILCFKANANHEAYMCIDKLIIACSSNRSTIERALRALRKKKYFLYTGKIAPKSNRIPIYKIDLNTSAET